jgi:serine/threonine protein kinase
MGVVYLGVDEDREVAVKVLHPHVAADLKARDRLTREVETMRRVRSPYVAEVLDAELTGAEPYIVTRFAPGRTLEDTVLSDGPLPGPELVRLAKGMTAALVAIHAADVIHRDFKPSNVILIDGEPLVIDFGIAHLVNATRLTQTGMFVGTPGYLAPEIIRDAEITQAADVHALASTVFFGATGKPPFGTGAFEVICFNIMNGNAQIDRAPVWLRGWLTAALQVDASGRPTAQQLHQMARSLDPTMTSFHEVANDTTRIGGETMMLDADRPPPPPPRGGTRVLSHEDSFSDLLPPVEYARPPRRKERERPPSRKAAAAPPPAAPPVPPYVPAPYADRRVAGPPPPPTGPARPYAPPTQARPYEPPGQGRPQAPPAERREPRSFPGGPPLIGGLLLVLLVAAACALPVVVSAIAIVAAVCLRVAEYLFGDLADRRKVRGSSGADPLLAVLGTPWALLRAAFATLVHVPLAAMFGMCVWGVLAYGAGMTTDEAAAYAAGAFTAGLFLLPGGGKPRKAVSRGIGMVVRSPGAAMIMVIALGLVAFFTVVTVLGTKASFAPWRPPSEVIDDLTAAFRQRTDEASMGVVDLVTGLVNDLLGSLGLGFLSFWS